MKHWTRYLPEMGRSWRIDAIETKMKNVAELKQRIDIINKEIREDERDLLDDHIRMNWTQPEIDRAKSDAKSKSNQ